VEEYAEQETSMKAGGKQSLLFDPECGEDMFLRNVGLFSAATRHYIPEDGNL
jgi:hypothetical protein